MAWLNYDWIMTVMIAVWLSRDCSSTNACDASVDCDWSVRGLWLNYNWSDLEWWLASGLWLECDWIMIDLWLKYDWSDWIMIESWLTYDWIMIEVWLMRHWYYLIAIEEWLAWERYDLIMIAVRLMRDWCELEYYWHYVGDDWIMIVVWL